MPLFFVASGAVYYIAKREMYKYKYEHKFISNKVRRLLFPYLSTSVILFAILFYTHEFEGNIFLYFLQNVCLVDQVKHLWFLIALLIIFIVFNHFEKYIFKYPLYSLLISFILYYIYPYIPWILQLESFCHYLIFFYCGYLFEKESRRYLFIFKKKATFIWLLSIHIIAYIIMLKTTFSIYIFNLTSLFCSLIGCLMAISFNIIITNHWKLTQRTIIRNLAINSFAIYLFHDPILYLIKYWINWDSVNTSFITLISFILIIGMPIIIAKTLRKAKVPWMIGE